MTTTQSLETPAATLTRPCAAADFRQHYEALGYVVKADGSYLVAGPDNGWAIDTWHINEAFELAAKNLGEAIVLTFESLFGFVPSPATKRKLTISGICELPKGRRHRPSRYR